MRVKVGKRIYSSDKLPIMLMLTAAETAVLSTLTPGEHKYAVFPADYGDRDARREWMAVPEVPESHIEVDD